MKHIGIVGVTAEGAALCLQTICAEAGKRLEKFDHPEITLHEQSFKAHVELVKKGDWDGVTKMILVSVEKLAATGADFAIMPANTPHYAYDAVAKQSPIPMLSIVQIVADECKERGFTKVGVLGSEYTMSGGLYDTVLAKNGIQTLTPEEPDRKRIAEIIFEIIAQNTGEQATADTLRVIQNLKDAGAQAVILGCTELPLIVGDHNSAIPTIDSTRLLSLKALEYAIE